ncbi:DUF397 domain-containing protein [Actinocorallia longicatena]|uniref:DUF397 domain-containing protein n=1 Tax=Actinocorallia longicatena TaxID=111803 RepID=A0ABP6QKD7_9ACTN
MTEPAFSWRKSSYTGSGEEDQCVEVTEVRGHVAARDSKHPERDGLTLGPRAWNGLLHGLKRR